METTKTLLYLTFLLTSIVGFGQTIITGKIVDENGEGLPGATISIKGTSTGTVTDYEGNYSLEANSTDVLSISFVGYLSQEIPINGQAVISVTLEPDVEALEEVVVVGYGTQKKSDITGSVASVKPKDLQGLPISRTDQALQGRIAGVNIQNDNAAPNAETRIRIRGSNSLLGSNNPLVVIDGFQDGNLTLVHADDIESIEVLKDASSLAIYGSKGANGAILITTKSGSKEEGLDFRYSNYFARHQIRNKLDLLNAAQYARRQNQDAAELGGIAPFTGEDIVAFTENGGTDWQDEIFREAWAMNHHVSMNGSGEKIDYFLSGDFLDQDGIVIGSRFKRYALRANMTYALTDKLKLDLRSFLSLTEDQPTALNTFSGENSGSPVNSALLWSPTDLVFTDRANRVYTLPSTDSDVGPLTDFNPVALATEPIRQFNQNTTAVNVNLSYELMEGLNISIRGGARLIDNENSQFFNNKPTQIEDSEVATIANSTSLFMQVSYLVNYQKTFGTGHSLNVTGLYEEQHDEFNDSFMGARGFISDAVGFDNLGLGIDQFPLSSSRTQRSLRSIMTRFNYGFRGKYLLTFTSRWDGSSVFGENNKWAFFPSGAIGWNIGDEAFIQDNVELISQLKLRASYGLTGSQSIPPGGSIGLIGDDFAYPLNGSGVVVPGIGIADRAANPDLKWETTEQLNLGLDIELANGRIYAVADYYIKTTNDLLFERPVPQSSGASTQFVNVGAMRNKGLELYLEGTPVDKSLKWTTAVTFARNRNEVLELIDGSDELPIGTVGFPGFDNFIWLEVGRPIGQFRGVQFDGVWQANEADEAALYGAIPGSPKAIDVNDDQVIDQSDVVVLGNSQPDFVYGWNNSFQFKNFDLNIFIQGVYGIKKLNLSRLQLLRGTGAELLDRWTPVNSDTDIPSAIGEATYAIGNSDRFIEDASYLRVKNISLGYNFPQDILNPVGLNTARVYVSAFNLLTLTNYSGYDPESSNSGIDLNSGVDLATFPEQTIYTVGLNVTF